jgi:hypothetical protein
VTRTDHGNAGLPEQGFLTSVEQHRRRSLFQPQEILFGVVRVGAGEREDALLGEAFQFRDERGATGEQSGQTRSKGCLQIEAGGEISGRQREQIGRGEAGGLQGTCHPAPLARRQRFERIVLQSERGAEEQEGEGVLGKSHSNSLPINQFTGLLRIHIDRPRPGQHSDLARTAPDERRGDRNIAQSIKLSLGWNERIYGKYR